MIKSITSLVLTVFCITHANTQEILPNDIVINEILFNPVREGYDYIEGFNRSSKTVLLNELMIGNRNSTYDIASLKVITKDSISLPPNAYFVVTLNEKWLRQHYYVPDSAKVCQVSSMVSLPDDEGSVLLVRKKDTLPVDELNYSQKWHFTLLKEVEGVALERISSESETDNENNWTSASSSSGYGTPGYVNSQFKDNIITSSRISVLPKIFSPDNNGSDDFVRITINLNENGKIANAVIFDASGRRVKYLLKNELLGAANIFTWDGTDDHRQPLPMGIYILFTQIFDLAGNTEKYRNCIVLSYLKK